VDVSPSLISPHKSDRISNFQESDRTPYKNTIAYSRRFTIAHLSRKNRSLSRKEKEIAFLQLSRSAIAPQSKIIKANTGGGCFA